MFNSKYFVIFINEKWEPIRTQKLKTVPKINEFVYFDEKYYRVVNVVHKLTKKHDIHVVVKDFSVKE
jgi:hypothetical protein